MRQITLLLSCIFILNLNAQSVFYPSSSFGEYQMMRTYYGGSFHRLTWVPDVYSRGIAFKDTNSHKYIDIIEANGSGHNIDYINNDNLALESKRNLGNCFKSIYKYPSAFYAFKDFDNVLVVNPVLNAQIGKESETNNQIFQNTRGAEIFGVIGGKTNGVGFYSLFTENQALFSKPYQQLQDSFNFVPNELFFKKFKNKGAIDYFQARAYVTFNAAKGHIKFKFGHDKHKIGNGYRSLILSDFAPQYLFLKLNTDVGRFHYQNLFTQFTDNYQILGNTLFGKKYGAFHRLSFNPLRNLSFGINEMVIFDRKDSIQGNQYDLNYLNPVIFYRAVESNLGSRDNSLMAIDFQWSPRFKYMVYGQFVLDEFSLKQLKTNPNWWGNKYAYQLGIRAFNLAKIKHLDVLLEYNSARPYTYSHYRSSQSYSHFNQALAHPLGANFSEIVSEIKYVAFKKLYSTLTFIYVTQGKDSSINGRNYGSNILRNYNTRATNNESKMLMGDKRNRLITELSLSYMLKHNLWIDARFNFQINNSKQMSFYQLGVRLNADLKQFNY